MKTPHFSIVASNRILTSFRKETAVAQKQVATQPGQADSFVRFSGLDWSKRWEITVPEEKAVLYLSKGSAKGEKRSYLTTYSPYGRWQDIKKNLKELTDSGSGIAMAIHAIQHNPNNTIAIDDTLKNKLTSYLTDIYHYHLARHGANESQNLEWNPEKDAGLLLETFQQIQAGALISNRTLRDELYDLLASETYQNSGPAKLFLKHNSKQSPLYPPYGDVSWQQKEIDQFEAGLSREIHFPAKPWGLPTSREEAKQKEEESRAFFEKSYAQGLISKEQLEQYTANNHYDLEGVIETPD